MFSPNSQHFLAEPEKISMLLADALKIVYGKPLPKVFVMSEEHHVIQVLLNKLFGIMNSARIDYFEGALVTREQLFVTNRFPSDSSLFPSGRDEFGHDVYLDDIIVIYHCDNDNVFLPIRRIELKLPFHVVEFRSSEEIGKDSADDVNVFLQDALKAACQAIPIGDNLQTHPTFKENLSRIIDVVSSANIYLARQNSFEHMDQLRTTDVLPMDSYDGKPISWYSCAKWGYDEPTEEDILIAYSEGVTYAPIRRVSITIPSACFIIKV